MKKIAPIFILFGLMLQVSVAAQSSADTTVLTLSEYLKNIGEYHPMISQGNLLLEGGAANELLANGEFDTKVSGSWDKKAYDDKNYYSNISSSVKVPTRSGIDIKLGYDRNEGEFLNQSDFLPAPGLWSVGISVPLLSGRAFDERRAIVAEAALFSKRQREVQRQLINETMFSALQAYINWALEIQVLRISEDAATLADERLQNTISSFQQGDKPAVDTLEAFITLEKRKSFVVKARQKVQKARQQIENYLWGPDLIPMQLNQEANIIPEFATKDWLNTIVQSVNPDQGIWIEDHYYIRNMAIELASLENERRLAKELTKPDIRLDYNPLVAGSSNNLFESPRLNDYKLGMTLAYPLQRRKGRGKMAFLEVKSDITRTKIADRRQQLLNLLDTYYLNSEEQNIQVDLLNSITQQQSALVRAEYRKFEIGESSIFLINSREQKLIESQIDYYLSQADLWSMRIAYLYYGGRLDNLSIEQLNQ